MKTLPWYITGIVLMVIAVYLGPFFQPEEAADSLYWVSAFLGLAGMGMIIYHCFHA